MRARQALLAAFAAIALSACTIVVHDGGGGGKDGGTTTTRRPPKHAAMLWLVNLDHSAVNLAAPYEQVIREFQVALAAHRTQPIVVDQLAVMSLNRFTKSGARLLYGERTAGSVIDPAAAKDLSPALLSGLVSGSLSGAIAAMAASSFLDEQDATRAEQATLAEIGPTLGNETVYLPDGSNVEGLPIFAEVPDLLIVGTLSHLSRPCAHGDAQCRLGGLAPADFLVKSTDGNTADWVRFGGGEGIAPDRIFHVSFVSAEGESADSFYARCGNTAGFPQGLVDLLEPSPKAYYGPLATEINDAFPDRYVKDDLCTMLGTARIVKYVLHASTIAAEAATLP